MESDEASARLEWWARVKHQGGNCRALENEISQRFFPLPDEDDLEQHGDDHDGQALEDATNQATKDAGNYEHGPDGTSIPAGMKEDVNPTKTKIFKGKGSIEDRPRNKIRKQSSANGQSRNGGALPIPSRDAVSEQLLVKELQNRIVTMCPLDDEEDDSESELLVKELQNRRVAMYPLEDEEDHSESELLVEEPKNRRAAMCISEDEEEDSESEEEYSESEAEKAAKAAQQPAASLFFGASGSLLSELEEAMLMLGE
jgi:hypothetical protein